MSDDHEGEAEFFGCLGMIGLGVMGCLCFAWALSYFGLLWTP